MKISVAWMTHLASKRPPVAILSRNEPAFYAVPAEAYEALMDKLEDVELVVAVVVVGKRERNAVYKSAVKRI